MGLQDLRSEFDKIEIDTNNMHRSDQQGLRPHLVATLPKSFLTQQFIIGPGLSRYQKRTDLVIAWKRVTF